MKQTERVKRYLRWAWYYKKKSDFLEERILYLRSKAQKITTTYQDAPVFGGFQDHRQQVIAGMVDTEREWRKMSQQCKNKLHEIQFVINMLDDPMERIVLDFHYLHFMNWMDVAIRLDYSIQNINKIHGKALMHLVEIEKKIMENGGKELFRWEQ